MILRETSPLVDLIRLHFPLKKDKVASSKFNRSKVYLFYQLFKISKINRFLPQSNEREWRRTVQLQLITIIVELTLIWPESSRQFYREREREGEAIDRRTSEMKRDGDFLSYLLLHLLRRFAIIKFLN